MCTCTRKKIIDYIALKVPGILYFMMAVARREVIETETQ